MENLLSDKAASIFRDLEEELLEVVIKRLKKGTNNKKDITQWQFEKMQDLGLINQQTIQKVAKATRLLEAEVEDAFRVGPDTVIRQVDKVSQKPRKEPTTNVEQIVKGYLKQAKDELNLTDERMALWNYGAYDSIDKARKILDRTASFVNTGMYTLEQGVEKAAHEYLTEGLKTTYKDRAGRNIPVDSYIRGVLKTNLGRTMDEVRKEHMEEYGMHHVVVGSLVGAREACSKIQGQVVDLRPMEEIPEDSEYRSIYDPYWEADYKEAHGHHGINCRHIHFPFIPGVNTNNQPQYDAELNEQVAKDRQKQRSLERQIRNYKKHLKIAEEFGNQKDIDRYNRLIRGRQKALRDHLDGHKYLSRDYARERAFNFSITPTKNIIKPKVADVVDVVTPKTMKTVSENAQNKWKKISNSKFINVSEEVNKEFKETMLKMFKKNHLGARIPDLDILDNILDTHFKNQMETGHRIGANVPSRRRQSTSNLFGMSMDEVRKLKPKDFEKYGYLVSKDPQSEIGSHLIVERFGDVIVTFKKENLSNRTTFTLGDSLRKSEDIVATPINDPSLAAHDEFDLQILGDRANDEIRKLNRQFNAKGHEPSKVMNNYGKEYVELQYHGEVGPNDIESVTYSRKLMEEVHGKEYVGKLKERLKELGIKINEVGE